MAAEPKYSFVIENSSGDVFEYTRAVKRIYTRYENDVGRCRFLIPWNDLNLNTTSVDDTGYSEIRIYRNGTLVWQGILQIVQDTPDGTWIYGEDYKAALGWYGTRFDQAHSAADIGTVITAEYDNIETRAGNFFTAKITQGTIQSPYQTGTTSNLAITRTLFADNFLTFLQDMVAVGRGEMTAAWDQNCVFDISLSESAPTFSFLRNVGSDKEDVVFELDSEILNFNMPRDFRNIITDATGYAIATGPAQLSSSEADATARTAWYRREKYPFYNHITAQNDLDQTVDNLVGDQKSVRPDMVLQFAPGHAPFNGYVMGDNIRLRINRGRIALNELRRVVGMEVEISDTGIETAVPILMKNRE